MPLKVNPYLVLGITKNEAKDKATTKNKFREKLSSARNNDEIRAKIIVFIKNVKKISLE